MKRILTTLLATAMALSANTALADPPLYHPAQIQSCVTAFLPGPETVLEIHGYELFTVSSAPSTCTASFQLVDGTGITHTAEGLDQSECVALGQRYCPSRDTDYSGTGGDFGSDIIFERDSDLPEILPGHIDRWIPDGEGGWEYAPII